MKCLSCVWRADLGSLGHAVTLRLPVQVSDPGSGEFIMDDRVHRLFLVMWRVGSAASVCRLRCGHHLTFCICQVAWSWVNVG